VNAFENGKTQLFNPGGVVKWAYFPPKKWSIPLRTVHWKVLRGTKSCSIWPHSLCAKPLNNFQDWTVDVTKSKLVLQD